MGNQAQNHQYAISQNWIKGSNVGNLFPQPQHAKQDPHQHSQQLFEQPSFISQPKMQGMPLKERNTASRIGSGYQPNVATLRHSGIDMNAKQPSQIKPNPARGSFIEAKQPS